MDEPRSFTVARYVHAGLIMLLLGLSATLSATEDRDRDEGLTLMWEGCRTVFSGVLVAFPSLESHLQRKELPRGKR